MTKDTLNKILNIAKEYHKGMNDYGICSPADLVISKMPELFNTIDEENLNKMVDEYFMENYGNVNEGTYGEVYAFKAGYRKAKEE